MNFNPEVKMEKKIEAGEASLLEINLLDLYYRACQILRQLRHIEPLSSSQSKSKPTPRSAWLDSDF